MQTIKMPKGSYTIDRSFNLLGEYRNHDDQGYTGPAPGRLLVKGGHGSGYGVGFTPPDSMSRVVHKGPLVPGPLAYTFEQAGVINTSGGTPAEIAAEKVIGVTVTAEIGDVLVIEGQSFKLEWSPPNQTTYIKLTLLPAVPAEQEIPPAYQFVAVYQNGRVQAMTENQVSNLIDMADTLDPEPYKLFHNQYGELYPVTVGKQEPSGDSEGSSIVYASAPLLANGNTVGYVQYTDH